MSSRTRLAEWVALYAASVGLAVVASSILIETTGGDWWPVMVALIDGSVLGVARWGQTLGAAAPMLLVALGTIVSSRVGLVNIGQEGQLLIGAAFAVYFGFLIGAPGPLNTVVIIVFGAVGGALWAAIAGVLRFRRGVPEVLSTLLLVTVATQAVAFGLGRESLLLADDASRGNRNQVSAQLPEEWRLPALDIFGNEVPSAVFMAVAAAVALWFVLARTVPGFRLRTLGHNPRAAQRVGISQSRYGLIAIAVSGALAGIAGAVMLAGGGFQFGNFRLVPGFSASIGWTGLLVALVARERALLAIPMAFVFGALRTGSGFVNSTGVEGLITDVIQGFLVLALLIPPAVMAIRDRRRARSATVGRT